MRTQTSRLLFCGFLSLMITPSLRAASLYTIQHIPGLSNNFTVSMNDSAQIVSGRWLWHGGTLVDLGSLGGTSNPPTYAEDINNSGQVVGRSLIPGNQMRAFVWQNGTMTALPTLGGEVGFATAINNRGEIAGYSDRTPGVSLQSLRATFWTTSHAAVDVGVVGSDNNSTAQAINNLGHVAGISTANGEVSHAFIWNGSTRTTFIQNGNGATVVRDLNDSGIVVGHHNSHAYSWQSGPIVDLGTLSGGTSSTANAINSAGQIVGSSFNGSVLSAFLYENSQMLDLRAQVNNPGSWSLLSEAWDINNSGQIVGFGTFNGSSNQVFLLTPIPEPAPALCMVVIAIVTSLRRERSGFAPAM